VENVVAQSGTTTGLLRGAIRRQRKVAIPGDTHRTSYDGGNRTVEPRSILTVSDTPASYPLTDALTPGALSKEFEMVSFSPAAFDAFLSEDDASAVVMLNLIRFVPDGGRGQYLKYLQMAEPILARFGAKILFRGDGLPVLTTGQAQAWDAVVLVQYPHRSAFKNMVGDPEYQVAFQVGQAAIADIVLQPLKRMDGLT